MKEHSFKKSTSLVCVLALVICMIGQTLNILAAGNPDLPDPSRNDCSITVHKIKRTTGSSIPGNGAEITGDKASSLGIPLPGVEFTLYKVDASQLSGQTITKDLTPKDAKDAATTISAKVTDDKGIVEWKNLEVGYYVLEETKSVANYDKCEMTIIKLPYSSKDGGSWNYNVHVYPKNVRDTAITKEFTDPADAKKYFNKDDKVKYTITGQLEPNKLQDTTGTTKYGEFVLTDKLDKRFTFVNNVSAYLSGGDLTSNESLSISDTGSDDIKFIKDTDASGDTLTWKLTNSGIDKVVLLAKNTSKKMAIQVTFELQVNNNAQGATDGQNTSTNGITTEIDNGASLSIKDADGTDEGIKSVALEDQPILQLSRLEITKWEAKASDGTPLTDKPLPGAKFKIATLKKDAEDGKYIKDKNNQDMEIITGNNPRTKDPETNWAAFVCISLPVNEGEKLYLVETKAPEGYIKRDTIIEVTFTKAEIDAKHKEEQVVNQKNGNPAIPDDNPSFELPKTGGMGTIAFWAVGIALIGTAGFMLIRLQQRKNEEAN